ncbi:MAG: DUF3124 domain-containing protein [Rhodoblastus sp.]|nr:DUF3124 domain-containing protein [Rhodoblastus sp.]
MGSIRTAILATLLALAGPAPAQEAGSAEIVRAFATSLTAVPTGALPVRGSFYVPAYSQVVRSAGGVVIAFSVTLTIHNVSETRPLVLNRIAYFDTAGAQVEAFLKSPVALKPLATLQLSIPVTDARGGAGANFLVDWAAEGAIAEPAVEALMLGSIGNATYSFVSVGRPRHEIGTR